MSPCDSSQPRRSAPAESYGGRVRFITRGGLHPPVVREAAIGVPDRLKWEAGQNREAEQFRSKFRFNLGGFASHRNKDQRMFVCKGLSVLIQPSTGFIDNITENPLQTFTEE